MDGWIKLWRKSIESQVWANDDLWRLWCYCLMVANHKDNWVEIEGLNEPILINRGQFITGRFSLHKAFYPRKKKTNKSPLTVWRWLQILENMKNLNIETNNKFSIVTICNYDTYQTASGENEQLNEQQLNNSRTTAEQQLNTNNNVKKEKKEKNDKKSFSEDSVEYRLANLLLNSILRRKPDLKKPNLQTWAKVIDLMIRVDERSRERIEKVIRWCQADHFWQNNILSTNKLRKHFDKLELQANDNTNRQDQQANPRPARPGSQGSTGNGSEHRKGSFIR